MRYLSSISLALMMLMALACTATPTPTTTPKPTATPKPVPTAEEIQKLKGEFEEWQSRWAGTYGPSPHTIIDGISSSRMINLPMCGTVIGSGGIAYKGFDMDPSVGLGTQEIALSGGHTVLGIALYSSGFTLEIRPPTLLGTGSWDRGYYDQLRKLLDSCPIDPLPVGPTAEEIQKLKGEFEEWQSRWEVKYGPSPHTITDGISSSRTINLPMCGTVIGSGGIAYKGFDMDPSVRLGTQEIALSGGHTVLGTPVYSSGFTLEIRPPALSGEESWTGKYFNQLRLLLDSCMIEPASETPPAAKPAAGKPEAVTQPPETNLELPEVTTGLVGHWKFDEYTGEVAKDSSDYGHDGSLAGIPTRAEGKFGGALSFDGVKDYVKISDASKLRLPTAQTISTWYKWAGSGADWRRLVGKGGYAKRNYGLWVNSDTGEALFQIWGLPARPGGCEAKSKVAFDTAWHHLAGTYDGARIQLYYDGILVDAKGCTTTPHTSSDSVTIGFANADGVPMHSPFHGFVDEVRIYNRTLSDCEIAALAADPC